MTNMHSLFLKVSAVLWVIWGLVHLLAGILVITADASDGFAAIADAVQPELLAYDYHPAAGGILNQHGWNLAWGGAVTLIGAIFIWRANLTAIWVTAMVGGLLDIGYFIFMDLPGHVNFVPGTIMTIVSASAILLSFWVWRAAPANT